MKASTTLYRSEDGLIRLTIMPDGRLRLTDNRGLFMISGFFASSKGGNVCLEPVSRGRVLSEPTR